MIKKFKLIIILLGVCSLISAMHAPRKTNKRKLVDTQQNKENKKRKIESQQDVSEFINKEIMESVFNPKSDPAPKIANYLENTSFSNILFACKLLMQDQEESIKKLFIEKYKKQLSSIIAPGSDSFIAGAKLNSKFIHHPLMLPNTDGMRNYDTNWKLSEDNKYLCTGKKNRATLWDLNSDWKKKLDYITDFSNEYLVEHVKNDKNDDNYISILDLSNKKMIGNIKSDPFESIAISSDSKYIATARYEAVDLWDLNTKEKIKEFKTKMQDDGDGYYYDAYFSPDNKYLIAVALDNYSNDVIIQNIWEIQSGQAIKEFDEKFHYDTDSLFSPDCKLILKLEPKLYQDKFMRDDTINKVYIFNLENNQAYLLKGLDSESLRNTYFSPDSKFLVTLHRFGSWENIHGKIDIYNTQTGLLERTLSEQKGYITHCCFNNDGKFIAIISTDGLVKIYNFKNGNQIQSLDHNKQKNILFESEIPYNNKQNIVPIKVEFSLDNKIIIVECSYDLWGKITFWCLENGQLLRNIGCCYSHSNFSKDNKLIVTGPLLLAEDEKKHPKLLCRPTVDYGYAQWHVQVDDLANAWIMPQLDLVTILFLIKLINSPKGNIVKNTEYKDFCEKLPIEIKRFVKNYYAKKIIKLHLDNNDLTNMVAQYWH